MPRRDPLKQKVIPQLQGVFGGEKARQALVALDSKVASLQTSGQRKLPKISDKRFSEHGKRRAASIPPKTAASLCLSSPTRHSIQQRLVNNNAFLGRGKFSTQRGSTIPASPTIPVSPPSISVTGKGSVI